MSTPLERGAEHQRQAAYARRPICQLVSGGRSIRRDAYRKRGRRIVSRLEDLSAIAPEQWREHYRAAVAAGRGHVICPDDERLAAPYELVALTLPELVRLGVLALLADGSPGPPREC